MFRKFIFVVLCAFCFSFASFAEELENHEYIDLNRFILRNPDIYGEKLPLCGAKASFEPCVLYIMNTDGYGHYAEDYFKEAARLTGRSDVTISVENPVYSKLRIPPSFLAEIKIPRKIKKNMFKNSTPSQFFEKYIKERYEVSSYQETTEKWGANGFIYNTSTLEIYKEFLDKEAFGVLNLIEKEQLMRQVKILDLKEESPQNWSAIMEVNDTLSNTNEKYSSKWKLKIKLCDSLVCEFKREQYQEQEEISAKK